MQLNILQWNRTALIAKNYLAPNVSSAKIEKCLSKQEVRKLQPKDQIQPTTCVCAAHKLRMVYRFLNDWKKNQKKKTIS